MKTGIVFKIEQERAIVMLRNGEFKTLRTRADWKVGDTVTIHNSPKAIYHWCAAVASLALFLICASVGAVIYNTENAVITIDINPSIEMTVNKFGRVISSTPMNKEAQEILSELSIKNKKYTNAVELLLGDKALEKYLINEDTLTFCVFTEDDADIIKENLKRTATETLNTHGHHAPVESFTVDSKTVEEARALGVTAGKYSYMRKLREVMPEIELQDYCHESIAQLKDEIEHCNRVQKAHDTKSSPVQEHDSPCGDTEEHMQEGH